RGKGCANCGVTQGWIHPEECLGCNAERPANRDYYPDVYNLDGTQKPEGVAMVKKIKEKLGIKW
ncbi:MAG: hypothetical protein ACFFCW_19890, partial [Candidatus Hodarchaeota archaeon]